MTRSSVRIVEVVPRDGLQALSEIVSTEVKVEIIRRLISAGLRHIEVTAFAHPRWVPQLADAEAVVRAVGKDARLHYRALVPNVRGGDRALSAGVEHLVCFVAATDAYEHKDCGVSVAEGLQQIERIKIMADDAGATTSVAVGVAFWCPYEGRTPESRVADIVERIMSWGIEEVVLADSIGCADPSQVGHLVHALRGRYPRLSIGLHLHDFTGMALTNAYSAWKAGADTLESSLGGIGGGIAMPVAPERVGNLATEDVVHLMSRCRVDTGIDLPRLRETAEWARSKLRWPIVSHLIRGGTVDDFLAVARTKVGWDVKPAAARP